MAKMAVEYCAEALGGLDEVASFAQAYATIREKVKYVQQEYVDKSPIEDRDRARFWLLIAICTKSGGSQLLSTQDAAISHVGTYDCIGIGRALGLYVIEPAYKHGMALKELSVLALHALVACKERVDGVGGPLQFLAIRDGKASHILDYKDIENYEKVVLEFRQKCNGLLLGIGNKEMSDEDFERRFTSFRDEMLWLRASWKGGKSPWDHLTAWIDRQISLSQSMQPNPQLTTADPSLPPASPESREASDES